MTGTRWLLSCVLLGAVVSGALAQPGVYNVEGRITAWDHINRTFRLVYEGRTYTVSVQDATRYERSAWAARQADLRDEEHTLDEHDVWLTSSQFWSANRTGQFAEVYGTRTGSTVNASHVELFLR
ncbi:hypothetical protein DAERI_020104 [Deinococcus aerius]|uniref:Uncharacterized protein n=3 Tax=Deinococcus TaxID=1298 RepID=A0A2I9DQK3_9DEIO|nr:MULTISPECIES: hypothetical protein [Deinococcus]ABW35040.1 hypothetical protein Dgeo_2999 [Deinococcus geothermalis DSM 11300]MBB5293613.1 hypothetical protein [Deinococcus metallilatus]QBY07404.1 hypothetical protein E5F05_05380 [Deinococcus metallilatus]RXJ14877.1 hypothetical protein ERJ73_04100 [Deinococcus metallilatus]TLK30998.1 hypothetical protein FCS05_04415 [Deinococcus metallilatus]